MVEDIQELFAGAVGIVALAFAHVLGDVQRQRAIGAAEAEEELLQPRRLAIASRVDRGEEEAERLAHVRIGRIDRLTRFGLVGKECARRRLPIKPLPPRRSRIRRLSRRPLSDSLPHPLSMPLLLPPPRWLLRLLPMLPAV